MKNLNINLAQKIVLIAFLMIIALAAVLYCTNGTPLIMGPLQ